MFVLKTPFIMGRKPVTAMLKRKNFLVGGLAAGAAMLPGWLINTIPVLGKNSGLCTGVCGSCGGGCIGGLGMATFLGIGYVRHKMKSGVTKRKGGKS